LGSQQNTTGKMTLTMASPHRPSRVTQEKMHNQTASQTVVRIHGTKMFERQSDSKTTAEIEK
jgi:hypothetical protein